MTEVRSCAVCTTTYQYEHSRGKPPMLCSDCRTARRREAKRNWVARNYEHQLALNRDGARRRRAAAGPLRIPSAYTKAEVKRRNRIRSYGITPDRYDAMWQEQGEACALCRSTEPRARNWHIDHDHETGTVRGILCGPCNTGIGHLQDNPDLMVVAAAYVRRHRDAPIREGA